MNFWRAVLCLYAAMSLGAVAGALVFGFPLTDRWAGIGLTVMGLFCALLALSLKDPAP